MNFVITNIIEETNDDKMNFNKIIRHFIEPACGTIERNEHKTRGEPVVGVAFEQQ